MLNLMINQNSTIYTDFGWNDHVNNVKLKNNIHYTSEKWSGAIEVLSKLTALAAGIYVMKEQAVHRGWGASRRPVQVVKREFTRNLDILFIERIFKKLTALMMNRYLSKNGGKHRHRSSTKLPRV